MADRFELPESLPAVQTVLFDTDSQTIARATRGLAPEDLAAGDAVRLPLRKPQDYRGHAKKFLPWLSRRWLYNIPRSLQTRGLRPLGRLAFVDHCEPALAKLRQAFSAATAPEAVAECAARLGTPASGDYPRVLIVSSISGGAGSGMVLDLAYAARKVLADLGLSDRGLCLILTHSTNRRADARDLAVANAYATLNEWWTYNRPGGAYPGDASCGLPAFEGANAGLPATYLAHLGDDLSDEEFAAATDNLGEYLFRGVFSVGAEFFDKLRKGPSGARQPGAG